MSLLDRLFGRKPTALSLSPDKLPTASILQKPGRSATSETARRRPFDIIAEALAAWQAGAASLAEELFKLGIDTYREREPDGVDFALGRYGAFLIDQGRKDDATHVLELAIARNTDIPRIWSDYLRLVADQRDFETFKRSVERIPASGNFRMAPELLLEHARRAGREGAVDFAEAVARWVIDLANGVGDRDGRWAAIGDLGRILERNGRLDEAISLWRNAFDEGSRDPDTASRLAMHLERSKDYAGSISVIREALGRGLAANVEESLRKRLARCEEKKGGRSTGKKQKRDDVAAYSIRRESSLFEPTFQIRLKPAVKDLELVGSTARCLLAAKESSTLVDIDCATGAEIRRIENLPILGDTLFGPDGQGIGIHRTAAVGQGPTALRFFGSDGRVVADSSVPDATSEVALGPNLWYVGCRNGGLYAFGFDGKQRWVWETPGSTDFVNNTYLRPCPYYVASQGSFAAVASMGNIYAVSYRGRTLWHAALPDERQTRWEFTIPIEGNEAGKQAYRVLGLTPNASHKDVKSAYRRLALETHPDRNSGNEDATAKFRLVQGAYERILVSPPAGGAGPAEMTVSMEIDGFGPTASFLVANAGSVVVGSSEGRLYIFDGNGSLREARVLGDGAVCAALRANGTVGAAWCSGALLFFKENKIVNAVEAFDRPQVLTMLGDDVVLARGNEVQVIDTHGRLLWSVEFSKTVTGIAAHGDTLVCAAGVLTAFRRIDG